MADRDSITVYVFDPNAGGAFVGRDRAWQSPEEPEGTFHMPANSTDVKPPATTVDQVAVWGGNAWSVSPDYRGQTVYSTTTGAPLLIETLGALPANVTTRPRPSPFHTFSDGTWQPDLPRLRTRTKQAIDAAAERARLRFVTPGAAQSTVYADKRREAEAWLATPGQQLDAYPYLRAELLRTSTPAEDIARQWIAKSDEWREIGPQIETIRLDAHNAVAAGSADAIEGAYRAAVAQLDQVGA